MGPVVKVVPVTGAAFSSITMIWTNFHSHYWYRGRVRYYTVLYCSILYGKYRRRSVDESIKQSIKKTNKYVNKSIPV